MDIQTLISKIEKAIKKLRNGVSKEDRDNLEFDINDFNIAIAKKEYEYNVGVINLDKEKDMRYKEAKGEIKTDAGMKRFLDGCFIKEQQELDYEEASIDKYKRLHSGFIRIAEHIKSNVIQEMADIKRNGF